MKNYQRRVAPLTRERIHLRWKQKSQQNDIGRVHLGDPVRIKVSAFPFQKYGTLSGVVHVISEDAFTHEIKNQETQMFYDGKKSFPRLLTGMEVQTEIRVGTRRIIGYFTDPLVQSLDEAIREP